MKFHFVEEHQVLKHNSISSAVNNYKNSYGHSISYVVATSCFIFDANYLYMIFK